MPGHHAGILYQHEPQEPGGRTRVFIKSQSFGKEEGGGKGIEFQGHT